jgi:alpha-L-rhamnosidase
VLLPAKTETVKRHARELPPDAVRKTDGGWFVDLGREIVGGLGAVIAAPQETEIEVRCGEELNPDGSVRFAMRTGNVYTARWHVGPGISEVNIPDLMTFRYAEFRAAATFTLERVHSLALRADPDDRESGFSSDSALLERLYDFTKYTIKMTTQDLYVDSQSRERGAYEGDALINMLAAYTFYGETAVSRATLEYLYTHRTWPAEYILLMPCAALADALRTGDLRSARKYYPLLRKDNFLKNTGANGLVHSGNRAAQGTDAVLYDWPPSERDNYDTSVLYPTVLNALQVRCLLDLAGLARLVGEDVDAVRFEAQAETLAHALTEQTFDPEQGAFCDGIREDGTRSAHCSQHASAYVLYCLGGSGGELLSEAQAAAAVDFIRAQKGLRTSVYGAFFVLLGLYRSFVPGAAELASELLLNEDPEDRRTWAYMLRGLGATLTAEAWCPENKPNMTFSHPWSAAPAVLISQGIFGLEPLAPGWMRFRVNFRRAGIGHASIVLPTPAGSVRAAFDGDNYEVVIPPGAAAEIRVGDRPVLTAEVEGPREFRFIVEKSGKFSE